MNDLTATQARKQLKTKIATLRRNMKFGVDTKEDIESVLVLVERLAQQPEAVAASDIVDVHIRHWVEWITESDGYSEQGLIDFLHGAYTRLETALSSSEQAAPQQPERVVERPPCESGEPSWPSALTLPENYSDPSKPQAVGLREAEYFVSEYVAVVKSKYSRGDCIQALARLLATPAPATAEKVVLDLAMMIRLLIRKHPNEELVKKAWNLLQRNGLEGSILREEAALERSGLPRGTK